ncbi:hypothetical protein [Pedobacter alpinus]|uniref:Glycosyl transferase family 6 n=1 Tax=Pedobacter alpinus TaxID=1590643 RepID=A0ABW5TV54_9SPHI
MGKYNIFWESFYKSSEKFFLTDGFKKEYFVFTDSKRIFDQENPRVHVCDQKDEGWPFNTLLRFHFFEKITPQLENFDFTFFFNANMLFNDFVMKDFLPDENQLLVIKHPGILMSNRSKFPYEANKLSKAFISDDKGIYYFMGSLNGGDSSAFNELIIKLKHNIDLDLENNIIAIWWDESHLNNYMLSANYKILSEDHVFIDGNYYDKIPKIIIRDKNSFGGHNYLRNLELDFTTKVKIFIKALLKKK